ncbi:MAG: TROVE domain-containing protein [Bacteroidaceae bacterium]|nr:TROVE domain-containing protein [Bacteroidaceae bacterium]
MSKFNTIVKEKSQILNHEGSEAFLLTPEIELYSVVVTSSLSDKFYETAEKQINRMSVLIKKCDHKFVAQLAVYARTEMNLRSIPLFLIVELAKVHSGDNLVSRTIEKVVLRADEIMELLICYQWRNRSEGIKKLARLSHQVQVGLQHAFNRFDEYQFAKYNRSNLEVKLRDALFLVHPKAKDEAQQELFNKIANKTLETPYTWETEMSALGKKKYEDADAKKYAFAEKWTELVSSGKLGYMALLRNLRNILEADVDISIVKDVAKRIGNAQEVQKSKQFPFRFLSAYRELKNISNGKVSAIIDSLEEAIQASAMNINGFSNDTRVLLACDVSGSMYTSISPKSSVKNYDIGLVLAMLLRNRCENVVTGIFGDTWKVVNMPSKGILSNVEQMYMREGEVGYSTNGYKVIEYLRSNNIVMDKVMMFTDCQMWNSNGSGQTIQGEWKKYKEIVPDAKLYLFDLNGYGLSPLKMVDGDVALIAGWSDRVFDMLEAIKQGSTILDKIKEIDL